MFGLYQRVSATTDQQGASEVVGLVYLIGTVCIIPGRLPLQQQLLLKNWSNKLRWNHKKEEETARRVLSNSLQMLRPFDPSLAMGLVVDTAKTTGIGNILFQFNPRLPVALELLDPADGCAGPMNFSLQGVWSVAAKGSWADLSPLEAEVVGYWHASRRLHYHILGAPVIYAFVDHRPFSEYYETKQMPKFSYVWDILICSWTRKI